MMPFYKLIGCCSISDDLSCSSTIRFLIAVIVAVSIKPHRQLKVYNALFFRGAVAAPVKSAFGSANWRTDDILISNVSCTGRESSLQECPYTVDYMCSISHTASVVCRKNKGKGFKSRTLGLFFTEIMLNVFTLACICK